MPRSHLTDLRFCCAANVVTASEGRESDAYRDSSNRLLGGWRAYDAEATPFLLRPATQDAQNSAGCGWVPRRD